MKRFVTGFTIGQRSTQIGIAQYSDTRYTKMEFSLNQYGGNKAVQRAIARMTQTPRRQSYMGHGLAFVRQNLFTPRGGDRQKVKNIVIVISGGATRDYGRARNEAKLLKKQGAIVITVGVGNYGAVQRFKGQIRGVAHGKVNAMTVTYGQLPRLVKGLAGKVCAIGGLTAPLKPQPKPGPGMI